MSKAYLALLLFAFNLSANAYWQQKVRYTIKVELVDSTHKLKAFEKVTYINNSPDTLSEMYFHLWPNAYQSGTPLDKQIQEDGNTKLYFGDEKYMGFLDSTQFRVNGISVQLKKHSLGKEVAWFNLPSPLLPGDSIVISTPFQVKVPYGEISRLGHLDDSYQITQWYPKPAVYDKNGWNVMPYLSMGEFYSEYGQFDVAITLPKKYKLAATGNLIGTSIQENSRTESYSINNVHDFAWFADTSWIEETSSVILPNSGRKVKTYMKYRPEDSAVYRNSVQFVDSALYYYSLWVGDYPYDVCGAVDGGLTAGAGMEYPTITVLGGSENRAFHEEVTVHEVGHNWFYGILGSNERKNPWMDEGINSYYERRYYEEVKPKMNFYNFFPVLKLLKYKPINQTEFHQYSYDYVNTRNIDQPPNLPANEYSSLNYGCVIYSKVAVCFNYLEKYLGKETFDNAMQDYFQTWKFKHPSPKDLRAIFEKYTNKNLNWFFDDLLKTSYPIDYKINYAGYSMDNKKFSVNVKNVGDVASPIVISGIKKGKVVNTVWYEGFFDTKELSFQNGDYDEMIIDYYHDIPEINRKNNRFSLFNFVGRIEPLEATRLYDFNKVDKTQVHFLPILGYNLHDNLQLGTLVSNLSIQEQKFRYLLMPQFSFGTNKLVGSAQFTYSIHPSEYFDKVNINLIYKKQGLDLGIVPGQIEKSELGLNFLLKKKKARSKLKSNFEARLTNASVSFDRRESQMKNYITFNFKAKNNRSINPYKANIQLQAFEQNWKLTTEFNYGLTINNRLQKIDIRGFAGCFLQSLNANTERFNLTANNGTLLTSSDLENFTYSTPDYLFDNTTYGRFITDGTSLGRQQIHIQDGGFKSGISTINSSIWIGSLNIVLPLPTKLISFYTDFGTTDRVWSNYAEGTLTSPILYDYGFQLNLKRNHFEIYFPLGYSEAIMNDYEIAGLGDDPTTPENEFNYFRRIKFMFNMNILYDILQ
ncbi:MAG: M1 family metallopeptidase [Flavobacteriales bacterium]